MCVCVGGGGCLLYPENDADLSKNEITSFSFGQAGKNIS